MRGKPVETHSLYRCIRITPADAGKTTGGNCGAGAGQDHPRGCGENCRACFRTLLHIGSPPRMRGKLPLLIEGIVKGRITPADAGKTKQIFVNKFSAEDHPRGCGENSVSVT